MRGPHDIFGGGDDEEAEPQAAPTESVEVFPSVEGFVSTTKVRIFIRVLWWMPCLSNPSASRVFCSSEVVVVVCVFVCAQGRESLGAPQFYVLLSSTCR